jgi:hypothetical protein
MQLLELSSIYERGLTNFQALTPLERDVFVVHDATLYYEMEGSLEPYLSSSCYAAQITWLTSTLERTGDKASAHVLAQMVSAEGGTVEAVDELSARFYELLEQRWRFLKSYLATQGVKLVA